jgi:mono/diheme cytochrome c family protein
MSKSPASSNPEKKSHLEQAGASDESIQRVHAILLREKEEPKEGFTPMPLFLLGFISTMIFLGAVYFVHNRGDFDPLVYDTRYDAAAAKAAASVPKELTPEQVIAKGRVLYAGTCAACHTPSGQGVAGSFPPLAGSEWVNGSEEGVIRILLAGLSGPVTVKGNTFNGNMPAFGPGGGYNWNDNKIAQVLTFVRQEWGNTAAPITAEKVAEIRKLESARAKPWSEAELLPFEKR